MKTKNITMDTGYLEDKTNAHVSIISIEYKDGFFEVLELATPVSKHKSLQEAQWVRSILECSN